MLNSCLSFIKASAWMKKNEPWGKKKPTLSNKAFENKIGIGENVDNQHILQFPFSFSTWEKIIIFRYSATLNCRLQML